MRNLLLAAAAIGGMAALTGGAMAAPGWSRHDAGVQAMHERGVERPGHVTQVDWWHGHHRYHHRQWRHGRWHYWD